MNLFVTFDEFLLDHFGRSAEWIQKLTGYDCLHQARLVYFGFCGMILAGTVITSQTWGTRIFCTLIVAGLVLVNTTILPWLDDDVRAKALRGLRNPRRRVRTGRHLTRALLLFYIALAIAGGDFGFMVAWQALLCLSDVLDACDPLPPQRGKIREWLTASRLQLIRVKG